MDKEIVQIVGYAIGIDGGILEVQCTDALLRVPFDIGPGPFNIEDTKVVIGTALSKLRLASKLGKDLAPWVQQDLEVEVP